MRILIVSEYFPSSVKNTLTGGVEARAWYVSRSLARSHKVTVITSWQTGSPREEVIDKVRVYRVGAHHHYANEGKVLSRLQFALAAFKAGLYSGPYDIIDGYNFVAYLPAHWIARKTGAIAVATYHEVWCGEWINSKGLVVGALGELWERIVINLRWDQFIAVSKFTGGRLTVHGVPESIITVVPNGMDAAKILKVQARERNDTSICMISRLVANKQPELLLKALACIATSKPLLMKQLKVKICGDGPLLENCRRLSSSLGLDNNVLFLGRLKESTDVYRLMKESSLLVLPSTREGFGIVLIEATVCGTPILTSGIPVLNEVQDLLGGGQTFRVGSAADLAEKIIHHFCSQPIPVGNAEHLCWDKISLQVESCYRKLAHFSHLPRDAD